MFVYVLIGNPFLLILGFYLSKVFSKQSFDKITMNYDVGSEVIVLPQPLTPIYFCFSPINGERFEPTTH